MNTPLRLTRHALAAGIIASGLALVAPLASAAVGVDCPGTVATDNREMTLTAPIGAVCLGSGTGNLTGNPASDPVYGLVSGGYVLIDKSDDTTSGTIPNAALTTVAGSMTAGTAGSFSISAPGYQNLVVGFHFGEGSPSDAALNPDWFAYSLPNGTTRVDWSILAGDGAKSNPGLSHVNLYGSPVPVPAAVWLLGSALAGVMTVKRRKHT